MDLWGNVCGDELNMIFREQGIFGLLLIVLEKHQEQNQETRSLILNDSQENMIDEGQASVNDENY